MAIPDGTGTPGVTSLDAERARLRAAGLTDDEISKIFVGRELGASAQQGGPPSGAPGQSPMTGVMTNLSAVWAHARGIIPAVAAQILTVRNSSVPASERLAAAISLATKAVLLVVFAYVVSLELSQLKSGAARAHADACNARLQFLAGGQRMSGNQTPAYMALHKQYDEECG